MKNLRRLQSNTNAKHKHPARPWVPDAKPGDKAMGDGKLTVIVKKVNLQTGQMTDTEGRVHGRHRWLLLPKPPR